MSYLYFIQGEQTRRIKIGISDRPSVRLCQLQMGSPDKLILLAKIKYDGYSGNTRARSAERRLHVEFKNSRIYGEWFEGTNRLLARIKAVQKSRIEFESPSSAAD